MSESWERWMNTDEAPRYGETSPPPSEVRISSSAALREAHYAEASGRLDLASEKVRRQLMEELMQAGVVTAEPFTPLTRHQRLRRWLRDRWLRFWGRVHRALPGECECDCEEW